MLVKLSKVFSVSTDHILGLNDTRYLEVTGLTDVQIARIQLIINDLKI
ncbi:MAG: hypothetical protein FWE62_05835 [Firmicutes bacterium]|nr:hypothetical protein [Bacillota bacterium]